MCFLKFYNQFPLILVHNYFVRCVIYRETKSLVCEDDTTYHIDKVTDIRQAAALKAGGQGDRYTIHVNGRQSYLFFERSTNLSGNVIGRWFVERKVV